MKSTILLLCLLCFQLNAQYCMIYPDRFKTLEYKYTASQFGLKGPVKSVTRSHETLNEDGEYETIHGVWGDHYFIDRLNFNKMGNLTSMYQETKTGDTMVVIQIDYDAQHRISKVAEHEMSIWHKYEPFKGKNWSSRYLHYIYNESELSAIEVVGDWSLTAYADTCRLDFQYEKGRVVKKTISTLDSANTIFNVREYNYNVQTGLLEEVLISIDSRGRDGGKIKFNYASDNQTLLSRVFSPVTVDEYMWKEATWKYDLQQNVINYSSGDSLMEYWFCYKDFQYNDMNDVILEYSNSENDGRNRLVTNYTYVYDTRKNWTTMNISAQNYIDFDFYTSRGDVFRRLREIAYYKL